MQIAGDRFNIKHRKAIWIDLVAMWVQPHDIDVEARDAACDDVCVGADQGTAERHGKPPKINRASMPGSFGAPPIAWETPSNDHHS